MAFFSFVTAGRKVLGMNGRNLLYIRPHNLKRAKRLADDKLVSKKLLKKAGVPVPKLLKKISSLEELEQMDWSTLPSSFVLKPNRGLGGAGIIVVYARKKGRTDAWVKGGGGVLTVEDLEDHIKNILEGAYSLAGTADTAFFEERLQIHPALKPYSYKGIPDIRIIVFNRVPVMAMLRVSTKASDGKANLQQGGIGIGIDMAQGVTTTAVQGKSRMVEYVPKTRLLLSGVKIPHWDEILELAVKAQDASGLGFLGADVAIDRERGPVFLELNARPGLSIQVANLAGLRRRLERVAELKIKTVKRGVAVGKNLFGGEVEESVEDRYGKKIIGSIEQITLTGLNKKEITTEAKIDTGAYSTSIDRSLARELGFGKTLDAFDAIDLSEFEIVKKGDGLVAEKAFMEKYGKDVPHLANVATVWSSSGVGMRPVVKLTFVMDKITIITAVNVVDREQLGYDMIIGKKNLGRFLVDVKK